MRRSYRLSKSELEWGLAVGLRERKGINMFLELCYEAVFYPEDLGPAGLEGFSRCTGNGGLAADDADHAAGSVVHKLVGFESLKVFVFG